MFILGLSPEFSNRGSRSKGQTTYRKWNEMVSFLVPIYHGQTHVMFLSDELIYLIVGMK